MHSRRIITSLFVLPALFVCIEWNYGDWFAVFLASFFFIGAQAEFYPLMGVRHRPLVKIGQDVLAVLFMFAILYHHRPAAYVIASLFLGGSILTDMRHELRGFRQAMATHALTFLYLLLPLSSFVFLRSLPHGPAVLYFVLAVACGTDIGGFYGGKYFGQRLLCPRISPNKTWEGSIAGILLSIVFIAMGTVIFYGTTGRILWFHTPDVVHLLGLTVAVSLVGQLGDLCESALKRDAGVKDSGSNLTGHGGFLDMMDALLWIGPAMVFYIKMLEWW